jgi:hypothetical protein
MNFTLPPQPFPSWPWSDPTPTDIERASAWTGADIVDRVMGLRTAYEDAHYRSHGARPQLRTVLMSPLMVHISHVLFYRGNPWTAIEALRMYGIEVWGGMDGLRDAQPLTVHGPPWCATDLIAVVDGRVYARHELEQA